VGVAVGAGGCLSAAPESRGATRAKYAGPVPVMFTNASPARLCGLFMSYDKDDDYGDNWLPAEGLPSGGSVELRVKPGTYKARWDSCKTGADRRYYAATLWRETAVIVERQTQLYAYVADAVAPTKRAATMGRDYRVIRFPGQEVDRNPQPVAPRRSQEEQVAERAEDELPPIAGFIGLLVLDAEQVAGRQLVIEKFSAHDFVDPGAKLMRGPAPAKGAGAAPATTAPTTTAPTTTAPATTAPATTAKPPASVGPRPSLDRKHDLSDSSIEYRKR